MSVFKKLFCCHKWTVHAKEEYEWDEMRVVKGTESWYYPKLESHTFSEVNEVLVCSECGKIKKITY